MWKRIFVVLPIVASVIILTNAKSVQPVVEAQSIEVEHTAAVTGPSVAKWNVNPWAIPADNWTQTVITAMVTSSSSTISQVTLNLAVLGGQAAAPMYDDGAHNDGAANDNVFGLITTATTGTLQGELPITLTAIDRTGNSTSKYLGIFTVLTPLTSTWPISLPTSLGWGTFTNTWQSSTGLPWNYLTQYLTNGWQTWGPTYVRDVAQNAWSHGYIPVFSVYLLLNTASCGPLLEEDCDFANLQNPTAMQSFFSQVTAAAQQANGQQRVIFHIEPDAIAYMQRYSIDHAGINGIVADNPNTVPAQSLSPSYPNTFSGVMHRLIDIIHQQAPNALVSLHARSWATGTDIAGSTIGGLPIDSFAQRTASFLMIAGGPQLDLIFGDWKTDDAGMGIGPWWDNTNLTLPNFSRMLHWQNRIAYYSGRRLILWKVPAGNMSLPNTCGAYQDNRIDYAFTHPRDLSDAGFIGVIVGGGDHCRTTPYTDGGNIRSKATVYYASPTTPLGLSVAITGTLHQVKISWSANPDIDLWGYRIYYGRSPTAMTLLLDARRQRSVPATLPSSGVWFLSVVAYDARGVEGPRASAVTVTLP